MAVMYYALYVKLKFTVDAMSCMVTVLSLCLWLLFMIYLFFIHCDSTGDVGELQ